MIHYHGLPITPATAAVTAISGGHAFISFRYPDQLGIAAEVCQSFALDNGAFSAWVSGKPVVDWTPYYEWVAKTMRVPGFDFAVIPDVVDGDAGANDKLLAEWPLPTWTGAPVWHLHEPLKRLEMLAMNWPRVCFGSSGEYAQIKSVAWWRRMSEAMNVVCDEDGLPLCKFHGLRMLDPDVYTAFPFSSADSTNTGKNIGLDSRWSGPYAPPTKEARALVMRMRIEAYQSATHWDRDSADSQYELHLCSE